MCVMNRGTIEEMSESHIFKNYCGNLVFLVLFYLLMIKTQDQPKLLDYYYKIFEIIVGAT